MTSKDMPYQPAAPVWTQLRLSGESDDLVLPQEVPTGTAVEGGSLGNEIETTLEMWLQWNEAYQDLTQRMYEDRTDFHQLEMLADQLDEMRLKAVEKTRKLLTTLRKTT